MDREKLELYLRDFAGRRNTDCIKRKFAFYFKSIDECELFQFAFNKFFSRWYKEQRSHTGGGESIASQHLCLYETTMSGESPRQAEQMKSDVGLEGVKFDPTVVFQVSLVLFLIFSWLISEISTII